jgi:hypothetical protein
MATRASIKISNSDGGFVANIYHHYDGYPEALGARLIEICDGSIVNGLNSGQQGKTFNGFDDLACSVVFELKGETGNGRVYLHAEDDFGQCGEDYLYEIVENPNGGEPLILVMNPFNGNEPELVSDVLNRTEELYND